MWGRRQSSPSPYCKKSLPGGSSKLETTEWAPHVPIRRPVKGTLLSVHWRGERKRETDRKRTSPVCARPPSVLLLRIRVSPHRTARTCKFARARTSPYTNQRRQRFNSLRMGKIPQKLPQATSAEAEARRLPGASTWCTRTCASTSPVSRKPATSYDCRGRGNLQTTHARLYIEPPFLPLLLPCSNDRQKPRLAQP